MFAHRLLPATKHMLHPPPYLREPFVAPVDVGLVVALAVIVADNAIAWFAERQGDAVLGAIVAILRVQGLAGF